MAFSDFIKDGFQDVHLAGGFEHSGEVLQALAPDADDAAKSAVAARALTIASEIGAKFDAEYDAPSDRATALFAEAQRYWSAPVPFGALPVPPPIQVFEQLGAALQSCVNIGRAFTADARKLAEAGAPKLKEYIDKLVADSTAALEALRKTPTAMVSASPANYGSGPGPMALGDYGQYLPLPPGGAPFFPAPYGGAGPFTPPQFLGPQFTGPPGGMPQFPGMPHFPGMPQFPGYPQMAVPLPFAPQPPGAAPLGGGMPMGGGMTPEQLKIMTDAQRDVTQTILDSNRNTSESYQRMNDLWSSTLK